MKYRLAGIILAAIGAAFGFGQNSSSVTAVRTTGTTGTAQFGPPFALREVTGAPYSAEEVNEQVQILSDGTRITRSQPSTKIYRDTAGRTRRERPLFVAPMVGQAANSPVVVEITDPVAQVKYTLDPVNKVAHRQHLQAPPEAANLPAARSGVMMATAGPGSGTGAGAFIIGMGASSVSINASGQAAGAGTGSEPMRPQSITEKLGSQNIEGVETEGTRHTMTWPTGSQGNDRPFSVVNEMWMSPKLKVMILSRINDPRSGENTRKLINLSQDEPTVTLFQPPPEYAVVDEEGAFTIRWGNQ